MFCCLVTPDFDADPENVLHFKDTYQFSSRP